MALWRIQSSQRNVVWKLRDGDVEDINELSDSDDVAMNRCRIMLRVGSSLTFQHLKPVGEQLVLRSLEGEKTLSWAQMVHQVGR